MPNKHKHEYHSLPCSDLEHELPLYCPECNNSFLWDNGVIMTLKQWNSYYDGRGNLLNSDNNPSFNNPTYPYKGNK